MKADYILKKHDMNDDNEINLSLDQWLKDFDAKLNGTTQQDLFSNSYGGTITHVAVGSGDMGQYFDKNFGVVGSNTAGGYTLTTSNGGTGNYSLNNNLGLSFNDYWDHGTKAGLSVKGDAEFEGDVTIKGKSLNKTLESIEEKLAILYPNEELEKKWEKLRELRKQYIELEKEIIQKEKMWDILKK